MSHTAERFGFSDPSSFSRMFKREFGLSPKEIRALGWQGILHSCAERDGDEDAEQTLDTLLINNSLNLSLRPFQKHNNANVPFAKSKKETDTRPISGTGCIYSTIIN